MSNMRTHIVSTTLQINLSTIQISSSQIFGAAGSTMRTNNIVTTLQTNVAAIQNISSQLLGAGISTIATSLQTKRKNFSTIRINNVSTPLPNNFMTLRIPTAPIDIWYFTTNKSRATFLNFITKRRSFVVDTHFWTLDGGMVKFRDSNIMITK